MSPRAVCRSAGARPGGRIVRIGQDGSSTSILEGLRAPVNGLTWHDGGFFISEDGFPGRISRWTPGSERNTVLDGLPDRGNYHLNMVAVGSDGWLYFSQGAMTNSGVVGLDAYDLACLKQLPHPCDLPGLDVTLAGEMFDTIDLFVPGQRTGDRGFIAVRRDQRTARGALRPGAVHGRGVALSSGRFGTLAGGMGAAQCLRPRLPAGWPPAGDRSRRG
jgi:hypothetical protein